MVPADGREVFLFLSLRCDSMPQYFPPRPRLKGRATELTTLARTIDATRPTRIALVGSGGSGKSVLACALGHALAPKFAGIDWFRVGAWDFRTLAEMLALRYGTSRERSALLPGIRAVLRRSERLVVLDNHEDDRAMARLLHELSPTQATFVITARRCLLAGVLVFPVTAPLVLSGRAAFPRVARLTRALRWNPLALDIADAIVASRAATVTALERYLEARHVTRVRPIDHEDDLPEVSSLVGWAWERLAGASRRMLAVLAQIEGDHMDRESLGKLARVGHTAVGDALSPLRAWHLVQEPMPGRYAVHAVVRYAVVRYAAARRMVLPPERAFDHYVSMLERHPGRLDLEQTHLFAAMDHANRKGDLGAMLRIERLLKELEPQA
jgi:hypothetical protein